MAKGVLDKDVKYNEKDPSWEELLITYHACHEAETGDCSTLSYWNGEEEAWISFVMLQSGHSLSRQRTTKSSQKNTQSHACVLSGMANQRMK